MTPVALDAFVLLVFSCFSCSVDCVSAVASFAFSVVSCAFTYVSMTMMIS